MNYSIEDKIFVNDAGNQVNYKRFVVTGYVDGAIETLELPISKDQATIYRLMKAQGHTVESHRGGEVEITKKTSDNGQIDLFDE